MLITDVHPSCTTSASRRPTASSQGLLATAFMVSFGVLGLRPDAFLRGTVRGRGEAWCSGWSSGRGHLHHALVRATAICCSLREILLGVSEGPLFSSPRPTSRRTSRATRTARPNSFVNMGTGLGLALGYPLVGFLLVSFRLADFLPCARRAEHRARHSAGGRLRENAGRPTPGRRSQEVLRRCDAQGSATS